MTYWDVLAIGAQITLSRAEARRNRIVLWIDLPFTAQFVKEQNPKQAREDDRQWPTRQDLADRKRLGQRVISPVALDGHSWIVGMVRHSKRCRLYLVQYWTQVNKSASGYGNAKAPSAVAKLLRNEAQSVRV